MRRGAAGTVAAFAVLQVLERLLGPEADGPPVADVVAGLLLAGALWWWRTDPRRTVAAVLGAGAVGHLLATPPDDLFAGLLTLLVAAYASGRHLAGRERPAWTAVLALGIGAMSAAAFGPDAAVFPIVAATAAAFAGAVLGERAALVRTLAERTYELEALQAARERDAALDERRRIARELHDVVAHTVSVMVVQAGGARRQAERDPRRALAALDQVAATGGDTLAELDRLFGLLHADADPGATASGLGDLPALVARMRAAGLHVELDVAGDRRPLAPEADLAAYRLVQEALTNTLKHAGPATARVAVRWDEGGVEVRVADDGHGPAGPRGDGARRGLVGMRERMAQLGGQVAAGPGPAGGFEVRARLPPAREEVHAP
jgi:signal transduction histidine kinase